MNVWNVIEANLQIDGNYVGLYGPPGTGKTHAAATYGLNGDVNVIELNCGDKDEEAPVAPGIHLFSMTMTDGSSEAELRGHFIPTADGGAWIDGPASLAWKLSHVTQTRLIINEIDRASDEVLSLLYAIADDPSSPGTMITLPNEAKERITPGAHFTVVATMNGVPEDLPEALQDRFAWIPVDEVNPAALASLPQNLRDHAASSAIAQGDRRVSIRKWLKYANLTAHGMDNEMAAYTAFGRDKYQDVLDSITVAGVVARVAAFSPLPGSIINGNFDQRFTSYEDIWSRLEDVEDEEITNPYCGWCHAFSCGNDDPECRPMQFVSDMEHEDFCAAYGLSTVDEVDDVRNVWAHSMLHRTHTRSFNSDGIADLTEIQFGQRIYPS